MSLHREDIRISQAGQQILPMHQVIIRDRSGNEVREFDYASKGKYVTDVEIIDNRIDLSCVTLLPDRGWEEARPEPITYTSDPVDEKLRLGHGCCPEMKGPRFYTEIQLASV